MQNLLLSKARPAALSLSGYEHYIIALKAVIDGPFLVALNENGIEIRRYNMQSSDFQDLYWLDVTQDQVLTKQSEVSFWIACSPSRRNNESVYLDKKLYHRWACCKECDLHGQLHDQGKFAVCPGCPHGDLPCCSGCHHPQHPHYEEAEIELSDYQKQILNFAGFTSFDNLQHQIFQIKFKGSQNFQEVTLCK